MNEIIKKYNFFNKLSLLIKIIAIVIVVLLVTLSLYLIKSAMGIDVFPHFSFGVWDWFKKVFELQG